MQGQDSITMLKRLVRAIKRSGDSQEHLSINLPRLAPRVPEWTDPYYLLAWMQRVYAQLVRREISRCYTRSCTTITSASAVVTPALASTDTSAAETLRARRDIQVAAQACSGQPVILAGRRSQASDVRCFGIAVPLLIIGLVLSPFWFGARHIMILPTLSHFNQYDTWGRHSLEETARGDPTAQIVDAEPAPVNGFRAAYVVYPILTILWCFLTLVHVRIQIVSGTTRALVAAVRLPTAATAQQTERAAFAGQSSEAMALLETRIATRDDKVSSHAPFEQQLVMPVFGTVPVLLYRPRRAREVIQQAGTATRASSGAVASGPTNQHGKAFKRSASSSSDTDRNGPQQGTKGTQAGDATTAIGLSYAGRGGSETHSDPQSDTYAIAADTGSGSGSGSASGVLSGSGSGSSSQTSSGIPGQLSGPAKITLSLDAERESMKDLSRFAMRFTSRRDMEMAANAATDWCPRNRCPDLGLEDWMFRPWKVCGVEIQAGAWIVMLVFFMSWVVGIVIDLTEGYPGAGVWAVAYLGPATTVPSAITDLGMTMTLYTIVSSLYIIWSLLFGLMRGMEGDLFTADGGNLVSIIASLVVETTPYFCVAYISTVARYYTGIVVRNRVERCMHAVSKVEADHEMAMQAARVQMPPFALRLLHGGATGVELEDTTAILVLRVYSKIRARHRGPQGGRALDPSGPRHGDGTGSGVKPSILREKRPRRGKKSRRPKKGVRIKGIHASGDYSTDFDTDDSGSERPDGRLRGQRGASSIGGSGGTASLIAQAVGAKKSTPTPAGTSQTGGSQRSAQTAACSDSDGGKASRDSQHARVALLAVGLVERVLQWGPFGRRATIVSVVGQDVVVAVHGEESKVFGLRYDDEDDDGEDPENRSPTSQSGPGRGEQPTLARPGQYARHEYSRQSTAGSGSVPAGLAGSWQAEVPGPHGTQDSGQSGMSSSGLQDANTSAERPITRDAAGCFNIATAIEIALKASWMIKRKASRGGLEVGSSVRLGAGIAFGSKTVCGFMSTGTSAHRWSVFGDGASEAQQLAGQGPGVRISSRALERLQSPSSWGIVHTDTLRRLHKMQGGDANQMVMPWMRHANVHRPHARHNLSREVEQAERVLVTGWRQRLRNESKDLLKMCLKQPMPVDAVAFGATVPATHFYEVPHDQLDLGGSSTGRQSRSRRDPRHRHPQNGGRVVWGDETPSTTSSNNGSGFGKSTGSLTAEEVSMQTNLLLSQSTNEVLLVVERMRALATARKPPPVDSEAAAWFAEGDTSGGGDHGGTSNQYHHSHMGYGIGATKRNLQALGMSVMSATSMPSLDMVSSSDQRWKGARTLRYGEDWVPIAVQARVTANTPFRAAIRSADDTMRRQLGLPRLRRGAEEALVQLVSTHSGPNAPIQPSALQFKASGKSHHSQNDKTVGLTPARQSHGGSPHSSHRVRRVGLREDRNTKAATASTTEQSYASTVAPFPGGQFKTSEHLVTRELPTVGRAPGMALGVRSPAGSLSGSPHPIHSSAILKGASKGAIRVSDSSGSATPYDALSNMSGRRSALRTEETLTDAAKTRVVQARHYDYKRSPPTRLVQNPIILFVVGIFCLLDGIFVVFRLAYTTPSVSDATFDGVLETAAVAMQWQLFTSLGLIALAGCMYAWRYAMLGSGVRYVCLASDGENGLVYSLTNLLALLGMRAMIGASRSLLLSNRDVACVAFVGMYSLPVTQMVTIMWIVVLLRSADLHGAYRPTIWMRIATLAFTVCACVTEIVLVTMESARSDVTQSLVGGSGSLDLSCRASLSPTHDPGVVIRVMIALRGLMAAIATLILQDERGILVVSMGDRIMRELQGLSIRMLKRRQTVYRVINRLVPSQLMAEITSDSRSRPGDKFTGILAASGVAARTIPTGTARGTRAGTVVPGGPGGKYRVSGSRAEAITQPTGQGLLLTTSPQTVEWGQQVPSTQQRHTPSLALLEFHHRLVLAKPEVPAVLAVRFRVAQMLDSLMSAVSLFRLVRMLAAVVEECSSMPYPGGDTITCATRNGKAIHYRFDNKMRNWAEVIGSSAGSIPESTRSPVTEESSASFRGLRVHVHNYGMTLVFHDRRGKVPWKQGQKQVGGYCPVTHAMLSASAAIAKVEGLQRQLGATLSMSCAVHVGGVVLGTVGASGQAWDAYGRGIVDTTALAAASAAVTPPDRSSIAVSQSAVEAAAQLPDQMLQGFTVCLGPRARLSRGVSLSVERGASGSGAGDSGMDGSRATGLWSEISSKHVQTGFVPTTAKRARAAPPAPLAAEYSKGGDRQSSERHSAVAPPRSKVAAETAVKPGAGADDRPRTVASRRVDIAASTRQRVGEGVGGKIVTAAVTVTGGTEQRKSAGSSELPGQATSDSRRRIGESSAGTPGVTVNLGTSTGDAAQLPTLEDRTNSGNMQKAHTGLKVQEGSVQITGEAGGRDGAMGRGSVAPGLGFAAPQSSPSESESTNLEDSLTDDESIPSDSESESIVGGSTSGRPFGTTDQSLSRDSSQDEDDSTYAGGSRSYMRYGSRDSNRRSGISETGMSDDENDASGLLVQGTKLKIRGVVAVWTATFHTRLLQLSMYGMARQTDGWHEPQIGGGHKDVSVGVPSHLHVSRSELDTMSARASGTSKGGAGGSGLGPSSPLPRLRVAHEGNAGSRGSWLAVGSNSDQSAAQSIPVVSLLRWLQLGTPPGGGENGRGGRSGFIMQGGSLEGSVARAGSVRVSVDGREQRSIGSAASFGSAGGTVVTSGHLVAAASLFQGYRSHWAALFLARQKRLRLLGAGAFGRVFMVRDSVSGAPAALKLFQKKQALRDEVRGEVTSLAALPRHPGVMQLSVCLAMTDRVALVTEYIKGATLQTIVSGAKCIEPAVLQHVVAQLVCALGVCHEAGILHRDLKPANIMVDSRTGHLKLIDFGLSVQMRRERSEREAAPVAFGIHHGARKEVAKVSSTTPKREKGALAGHLTSASHILRETHTSSKSTSGMYAQLAAVSPCMSIEKAHQKMANLLLPCSPSDKGATTAGVEQSQIRSEQGRQSGRSGRAPKSKRHTSVKQPQAPLRPMRREAPDGTRLLTSLAMLVFDQSIAGGRNIEYLRRTGRRHRRLRSRSSSSRANSAVAAGQHASHEDGMDSIGQSARLVSADSIGNGAPGQVGEIETRPLLKLWELGGVAGSEPWQMHRTTASQTTSVSSGQPSSASAGKAAVSMRPTSLIGPAMSSTQSSADDSHEGASKRVRKGEPSQAASSTTQAATAPTAHRPGIKSSRRRRIAPAAPPPATFSQAVEMDPRLAYPQDDRQAAQAKLNGEVDAFEAIDIDARIVPSLVWSPAQLRGAITSDGPEFDTVVLTDVADPDVAVGLLVILAEYLPPAMVKSFDELQAAMPQTERRSDHGEAGDDAHGGGPELGQNQEPGSPVASGRYTPTAKAGHQERNPNEDEEAKAGVDGPLAVPLSVFMPRITIVFAEGLDRRQQDRIRFYAQQVCPGVSCIPLETTGWELYSRVILPGFARAARWQELCCQHAMGVNFLTPRGSSSQATIDQRSGCSDDQSSWDHLTALVYSWSQLSVASGAQDDLTSQVGRKQQISEGRRKVEAGGGHADPLRSHMAIALPAGHSSDSSHSISAEQRSASVSDQLLPQASQGTDGGMLDPGSRGSAVQASSIWHQGGSESSRLSGKSSGHGSQGVRPSRGVTGASPLTRSSLTGYSAAAAAARSKQSRSRVETGKSAATSMTPHIDRGARQYQDQAEGTWSGGAARSTAVDGSSSKGTVASGATGSPLMRAMRSQLRTVTEPGYTNTMQLDGSSQSSETDHKAGLLSCESLGSDASIAQARAQCATPILELKREFAKGFAGSPAFIAPEVIKGEPAKGFASDWYSLGVCIFRLACGRLPYDAASTDQVLLKGRDGRISWERLQRTSDPLLLDLIVGLLEQDPLRRYGARGGAKHLMRHPFFAGVDFDTVYAHPSPLLAQHACSQTQPNETFADRTSAVDFITYARGLVAGMPLGPRRPTIGGWLGMATDGEEEWWDTETQAAENAAAISAEYEQRQAEQPKQPHGQGKSAKEDDTGAAAGHGNDGISEGHGGQVLHHVTAADGGRHGTTAASASTARKPHKSLLAGVGPVHGKSSSDVPGAITSKAGARKGDQAEMQHGAKLPPIDAPLSGEAVLGSGVPPSTDIIMGAANTGTRGGRLATGGENNEAAAAPQQSLRWLGQISGAGTRSVGLDRASLQGMDPGAVVALHRQAVQESRHGGSKRIIEPGTSVVAVDMETGRIQHAGSTISARFRGGGNNRRATTSIGGGRRSRSRSHTSKRKRGHASSRSRSAKRQARPRDRGTGHRSKRTDVHDGSLAHRRSKGSGGSSAGSRWSAGFLASATSGNIGPQLPESAARRRKPRREGSKSRRQRAATDHGAAMQSQEVPFGQEHTMEAMMATSSKAQGSSHAPVYGSRNGVVVGDDGSLRLPRLGGAMVGTKASVSGADDDSAVVEPADGLEAGNLGEDSEASIE